MFDKNVQVKKEKYLNGSRSIFQAKLVQTAQLILRTKSWNMFDKNVQSKKRDYLNGSKTIFQAKLV